MCSATEWWDIKRSLFLLLALSPSQVSQISSVFDCLLEEEERTLKENHVDSVQWAEVVLTVNNIIKVEGGYWFVNNEKIVVMDHSTDSF